MTSWKKIIFPCYLQRNHPSSSITSKESTWVIFLITQRTFLKYFQLSNLPQAFSISTINHPKSWFYLLAQSFVLCFKFLFAVPIIPVSFACCPKPEHHSMWFPEPPAWGDIPLPTWISPWWMPQLSLPCSLPDTPQAMQIQYLFKQDTSNKIK